MAITESNLVTAVVREFSNVSTALVGFKHSKLVKSGTPKSCFTIYTSESDETDTTGPYGWKWVGNDVGEYYRGPQVWLAYNGEIDRDPIDQVIMNMSEDDGYGVRDISAVQVANKIEKSTPTGQSTYTDRSTYTGSNAFNLCGKVADSVDATERRQYGFCVNLDSGSLDTNTIDYFKWYDVNNRLQFLVTEGDQQEFMFGVGVDESYYVDVLHPSNSKPCTPYFIGWRKNYKGQGTKSPFDEVFLGKDPGDGYDSNTMYTPQSMLSDIMHLKKLDLKKVVSAFNHYCVSQRSVKDISGNYSQYSYVSGGNYNIFGNFGVLGTKVSDDSSTTLSVSDAIYPYVFMNTAKSSYYILATGYYSELVTESATGDYSGTNVGITTTAYIPSYRFAYDYYDTADPFTEQVQYTGKKPVPIKDPDPDHPNSDLYNAIKAKEAGAVLYDTGYTTKQEYLNTASYYYKQWPSVRTTTSDKRGDIVVASDKSWLAFIDDISSLNWTDSLKPDPAIDYQFIKSCNYHCFHSDENIGLLNGVGYVVPYGYTPTDTDTIGSCINGVAAGGNSGVIKTPATNCNCMNLFRIHNLRFTADEIKTAGIETSAYYSLKWGYTGIDGIEEMTPATLGTIKLQRLNTGDAFAVYNNGDVVAITDGNIAVKRNGNVLDKVCIVNSSSEYFDAFTAKSSFNSFVDYSNSAINSEVSQFFSSHNRTLSGSEMYFGETGLFSSVDTPINYDSLGTTAYPKTTSSTDGNTIYNVFDSIDWDVSVAPKLDDATKAALVNIGITDVNSLPIPGSLKSGWYIWIDKTTSTSVDPNIKLEILDCKGLTDDGSWINCRLPDVTELAKDSSGGYTPPTSSTIDTIFESNSVRFSRVKLRFRMVCEGNSAPFNKNGYAVHLGFSIKNQDGVTKDFQKLHTNYINPLVSGCENFGSVTAENGRTYYCGVSGRKDIERNSFGVVYGKSVSSAHNLGVAVQVNDTIKTIEAWLPGTEIAKKIWKITDVETDDNVIVSISQPASVSEEMLYYIKATWVEDNIPINSTTLCKVTHNVGTYFKSKTTENFEFDVTGSTFGFRDDIGWNDAGKYYAKVTTDNVDSLDVAKATYSSSIKDSVISIFNIDTAMSSNEVSLTLSGDIKLGDRYAVRVGGMDANEIIVSGQNSYPINIDKNIMSEDSSGKKYIRIIISKDGDVSSEIPLSFSRMNIDSEGIVTFTIGYYEATGGIVVDFRDYKQIQINATVEKSPELTSTEYPVDEMFYIVNGFKNLSFGSVCEIVRDKTVPVDPQNNISLNSTRTEWIAHWIENHTKTSYGRIVWSTAEGSVFSTNSNKAIIRLTADNYGQDVGKVKYKTVNNALAIEGKILYTYDIKIDGSIRIRVTDELPDKVYGIFEPIRVCTEPILYFMSNVIKYHDPIFVINETDNTLIELAADDPARKIYRSFDITTSTGETWGDIPADDASWATCGNFSTDVDVMATYSGKLAGDWVKNDERLKIIAGSNQIILHVINGGEYDENVTRVIGGYKLKYPYSRESILFSPNEWVTADNLNVRFKKITENLKYFERQTKFYLRPPSMYCGYYGDFKAKIQGSYSRVHGGFVSIANKLVYKQFNENNSIDDDQTYIKNCLSIAVSKPFIDECKVDAEGHVVTNVATKDVDNNLYVCLGDKIRILGQSTYAQNTERDDIVPKRTNEFIDNITRIFYSNETNLLYCLSPKTHKIYMFNRYKHESSGVGDPQNASYYGEIGGYGGPTANNKFNNPNDFFVSSVKDKDGENHDEIWVCDGKNRVIKHYTIKGQWINTINMTVIDYDILGVCVDYKNQVHALTNDYVFTFTCDGNVIRAFELRSNGQKPLMIRPQYNAGFLYVLYEHRISKYSFDGKFIADFAENDELTYTCICPSKEHDIYIGTNKNVLQYSDTLRMATIGATKNAHDYCWSLPEIYLNRNENIQDSVLNTSMQRMYDNIRMFSICTFGRIIDSVVKNNNNEIVDFDKSVADSILNQHHKEQIFVGINELVTLDVINRSFSQMYDLLDLMLKSI